MTISFKSNLRDASDFIGKAERQVSYATSLALNRTAAAVKEAIEGDIVRVFDRPTPYTQRSVRVVRATRDKLAATVDFKDAAGKGIAADRYLSPQVYGGGRNRKRMEIALQRAGIPTGSYLVPGAGAELDGYGNMSRGQIVRVMSYLQAFGEQGYRANATAKSRARTAKIGRGKEGYKRIGGVQYFVSRGKGSMSGNREQRLPAGVWRKTGTHGSNVLPVLVATDAPMYTPLLPFYETSEEIFYSKFDAEFDVALETAFATAR